MELSATPTPTPSHVQTQQTSSSHIDLYVNTPKHHDPNEPKKFIMATNDEEAHAHIRALNLDSKDVVDNTNLWAHAQSEKKPSRRQTIDVGDIETNHMNLHDKSLLLHDVAMDAEKDLTEQVKTSR